jgi:tRNA (mo5U34)-methyltransferase
MEFWHRIRLPNGSYTPGKVNHGPDGGSWPTTRFGLPEDLTGKSVLDIGTWDGFFSFEAERRGAKKILATDIIRKEGFTFCKETLKSKVEFNNIDINESLSIPNTFDFVMCFGVLYHVKNPLIVIENLFRFTSPLGICLIETAISQKKDTPSLEYRPGFEDDPTNYFYPNSKFIELAGKEVGFNKIEEIFNMGSRATYRLTKGIV